MTGLRDESLEAFTQIAHGAVERGEVPGVVALAGRGDDAHLVIAGRLGFDGPPLQRGSLFRIASITKPITAATVLTLVDAGLLDLDEPVDRLLPELADRRVLRRFDGPLDDVEPARRAITTRDLLTFTFGFGVAPEFFGAPDDLPILEAVAARELHTLGPPEPAGQPPPDEWIARLGELPLVAQPGERWLYNTGASVLGVLAARAGGATFPEVLATSVFAPLGMVDTAMFTSEVERLTTAYARGPGGLQVWDAPDGPWSRPPAFADGAAGLLSTVDDLHAFSRMLLRGGGGLLSAPMVREMTRDQLTPAQRAGSGPILDGSGWGFCQSVEVSGDRAGAFGWTGGLGTSWTADPARDLTVIVLTQRMFDSPALPPLHAALRDLAYAATGA